MTRMTPNIQPHDVEDRFRLVADYTYDWEYWIGPGGEFHYVSPSCERVTGYTPDEFIGDPGLLLRIVHPDDRPLAEQHEQSDSGGAARTIDYRIVTRGGEERWIGHVCQPVYARDGEWLGYRASNRDVTETKRAQIERGELAARQQELFACSQAVLAEDTVEGLLQCIVDAGRALSRARVGSSGHGSHGGEFVVSATSRAGDVPPCPEGEPRRVERGCAYLDLIRESATLRLTDDELRTNPAWPDLPAGHSPLRGLLGARLVDRDGRATGSIMVSDKEGGGDFTPEDEVILGQLAAIASLALQQIDARLALASEAAALEWAHEELTATGEELRQQNEELQRSEQALRASEERYRHLFDGMTEGFAVHDVICDARGEPVDYRFLEVNSAFELLTGLKKRDLVGKTVLEVLPGTERFWIETYGRVALSGERIHFEQYSGALDRHYAVSAYRPAENQFACIFLDITERVKIEHALREGEDKLLALLEILPVGVSILDSERNIRYMNPALSRALDLPPHAAGEGRHTQRTYRRPDGSPMLPGEFPSVRAVEEQRIVRDVEIGVVKEDGTLVWTNVSAAPLPFDDWSVLIVTADVTEQVAARKRIEELATQAQRQAAVLDTMLASIAESVVFYGPDGRVARANAAAHKFFGYRPDEEFRPLAERVAENRASREDGTLFAVEDLPVMHALRGETVAGVNMALYLRPGPPAWTSVSAAPVSGPDGELLGAIVSFTDVTELRRARDELEERVQERTRELTERTRELVQRTRELTERTVDLQRANENLQSAEEELSLQNEELVTTQSRVEEERRRYQELFHFAPDGYLVTTLGSTIIEANRAAGDLLGLHADELPGKRLDQYVLSSDSATLDAFLHQLQTGKGGSALRWEMRLLPQEGEVISAAVAAAASRSISGEIEGVRWLLRDVTREKQMHAALVHAEKLSIAGQLAASFAHEIKNPLAAAIGCVDLVREAIDDDEDPSELLGIVQNSLDRATRLVGRLQELHQRSEMEEKQPADLNELVEGVLLLAGKRARSSGVEVSWHRAEGLPELPVMVDGMQQVFLNLVLNAVEAMQDGGHLDVSIRRTRRPARIGVQFADDGGGIAPQIRDRLFEPFKTTKAKGSGLGLFISQNIVHQHGGSIEVESVEGEGTRFTVWLPA